MSVAEPEALAELAADVRAWRVRTQPDSFDDLPRVPRPPGWVADWSPAAVRARHAALRSLRHRYAALDLAGAPVAVRVDGRLLGADLARAEWELQRLRGWQRNPWFAFDQCLQPVYQALLAHGPADGPRVLRHLRRIPRTVADFVGHLAGHGQAPYADVTVAALARVRGDLGAAMSALAAELPAELRPELAAATAVAVDALTAFRGWLLDHRAGFAPATPLGPGALRFLLHEVALLPYSAEQILDLARHEGNRAAATEAALRARAGRRPPLCASAAEQRARQRHDLDAVRRFRVRHGLLSPVADPRDYRFEPLPGHLRPLTWLGVLDDLSSPAAAVRYIPEPAADLPYFQLADALDPRLGICHEGVHAEQFALSAGHPHPVRRFFHDSTPNEGIAFYHEELVLAAGLFDDAPASAAVLANFQRLRAVRAEVDLRLALGELSIDDAAGRLAGAVPVDEQTAWEEAVAFAANPGQGLSYLVGKAQVHDLVAAGVASGVDLRDCHDRLWRNGNVPLVLQHWEAVGDRSRLDAADRLAGHTSSTS